MSEMIERVRQVLLAHIGEPAQEQDFHDAAVAVIEAMREPTEEMEYAGDGANSVYYAWQAMIDQALTELGPRHPAGTADLVGVPRAEE